MADRKGKIKGVVAAAAFTVAATGAAKADMEYQTVSDLLHLVMSSDRTVYTRLIVNRLQNEGIGVFVGALALCHFFVSICDARQITRTAS